MDGSGRAFYTDISGQYHKINALKPMETSGKEAEDTYDLYGQRSDNDTQT